MFNLKVQIILRCMICTFVFTGIAEVNAQSLLYPQNAFLTHFDSSSIITLTYENDFPNRNDEYYTQGISINYTYLKHEPKLKIPFQNSIAITHLGYTPQDISDSNIRYGDRPYAAALFLQASIASDDSSMWKSRFSYSYYLGILGPAAGGEWMQRNIHKAIKDVEPQGWKHQIQNSLIIGTEMSMVRRLLNYRLVKAHGIVSGRLTSLKTQLTSGATMLIGLTPVNYTYKKTLLWMQYTALANLIAYDATLQGDLFGNRSIYTIRNTDISRLVFHHTISLNIWIRRLRFQLQMSQLTKEFKTAITHTYSGLTVGYRL